MQLFADINLSSLKKFNHFFYITNTYNIHIPLVLHDVKLLLLYTLLRFSVRIMKILLIIKKHI